MENHIFYSEIRNQIVSELLSSPGDLLKIKHIVHLEDNEQSHFSICSEAARVFYAVQDLSGVKIMNQSQALSHYSKRIFKCLIKKKKLAGIDMVTIASQTIQQFS
ncbi:hypothetical protein ACSIGC_08170 [Tenacibaculum sp. ZS6-P6]|uniref:hypothetical protein n=1 Tax=Tenacibaculum sp. ZS6-P6 TaxID=3447503 RepID=UPI003F984A3B